ncbi:MAG TPA: L-threonylcarbamoyladenylate synthase [Actinomycetota bacterium]|nr:L-threonylcarbamoyladenylate synthase [Actinomycetota bacterium]
MSSIEEAIDAIKSGLLAVIPTDTVYGIAALPNSEEAIAAVFDVKGRSKDKGLPILAASPADLGSIARPSAEARVLAAAYWPGPLTLVVPRADTFAADIGGTDPTSVAVRVPNHDITRAILEQTGPLAVTSANISGMWAATTIAEARAAVGGDIKVFLDSGVCDGATSTIVSLMAEPAVIREGPVSEADVLQLLAQAETQGEAGDARDDEEGDATEAPDDDSDEGDVEKIDLF